MEEVLYFALKGLVVFFVIGGAILLIAILATRAAAAARQGELEITPLHHRRQEHGLFLKSFTQDKKELKAEQKRLKNLDDKKASRRIYVLNFEGDIYASAVEHLRHEVTALLQVATPQDEVVIKLHSPGGVVHGYGHAASQLARLRSHNIPLTACVDEVAASGGYMMACVANKILAAPMAIVGSIGVLAQVPNFHRLLQKHEIDYQEYTAGDYKRTVSVLGKITPQGEQHFLERLNDTHRLFQSHVKSLRPNVDLAQVASGDHWYGEEAMKLGLVDGLQTSDEYLSSFADEIPVLSLKYSEKKPWNERFPRLLGQMFESLFLRLWSKLEQRNFF